jgi:hypothetical protein
MEGNVQGSPPMRIRWSARRIGFVNDQQVQMRDRRRKRLTLELEPDAEPIEGRIREGRGPAREFVGWLGLAAALERVLGPGPRAELDKAAVRRPAPGEGAGP